MFDFPLNQPEQWTRKGFIAPVVMTGVYFPQKGCLFVGDDSISFRTLYLPRKSTKCQKLQYSRESNAVMQQQTFSIPHKLENEEHDQNPSGEQTKAEAKTIVPSKGEGISRSKQKPDQRNSMSSLEPYPRPSLPLLPALHRRPSFLYLFQLCSSGFTHEQFMRISQQKKEGEHDEMYSSPQSSWWPRQVVLWLATTAKSTVAVIGSRRFSAQTGKRKRE